MNQTRRPQDVLAPKTARAFSQRFIDEVSFDLQDQPARTHGGRNWVKIPMPSPGQWLTGYGDQERLGVYLSYDWDDEPGLFDVLLQDRDALRRNSAVDLTFDREKKWIGIHKSRVDIGDENAQIEWLCKTANGLVTALRPRLHGLAR